jgi:IS30 family transposase
MQTDWGGEYQNLHSFFAKVGISYHISCPYAHQQNGSAERKHRHIVEVGLALLAHASMPLKYWDDAFLAAVYLINHTPSKIINYETPLECLFHQKTNYSFCTFLVVLVGLTFVPIILISFNSAPVNVSF